MPVTDGDPVADGPDAPAVRPDDEQAALLFADAVARWGRPSVLDRAAHSDVLELCHQVERWPLALELAARRTSVQSVPDLVAALHAGSLAAVLDGRPDDTARRVLPSIVDAVSASLASLRGDERRLAAQLAGFVDWSTFTEIVDGTPGRVGFETLAALVDQDIVDVDESQTQTLFRLRRAYREMLLEGLREDGVTGTRARAAEVTRYASLEAQAIRIVDALIAWSSGEAEEMHWYEVVRRRHADLQSTAWMLLARADPASTRAGARIAVALTIFAAEHGDLAADRGLLDRALQMRDAAREPSTALILEAYRLRRRFEAVDPTTDTEVLAADLQSAVSAARAHGDHRIILECLAQSVGSARTIGHLDQARRHADEGAQLAALHGMSSARANFELLAAMVAHAQGRYADAAERASRAYVLARRLDQPALLTQAALMFHQLPAGTPHVPTHRPSVRDLARMVDALPARRSTLGVTDGVAAECLRVGDFGTAARAAGAGIRKATAIGLATGAGVGILIVVVIAAASGQHALAARLHGAIADHYEVVRNGLSPGHRATYEGAIGAVRTFMGDDAFTHECDQGASLTWTGMIALALAAADAIAASLASRDVPDSHAVAVDEPTHPALTARQLEVLGLLAAGMSNKEIAGLLSVAPKTMMHHTSNIYRRLGVRGRGEAVAVARQLGIA